MLSEAHGSRMRTTCSQCFIQLARAVACTLYRFERVSHLAIIALRLQRGLTVVHIPGHGQVGGATLVVILETHAPQQRPAHAA